jgi:hypothetical protein
MSDLRNRIGKFYISRSLVLDYPELVQKVLSKVVVVRCESVFHSDSFEYIAFSNRFDICEEGYAPPVYIPIMTDNCFVSFKKEH